MLVRYVELWRAAGVEKLYFYHQSVTEEIWSILQTYSRRGFIELIDWSKLEADIGSGDPNKRIYRGDIFTAINDCLLRNRHNAKYTAFDRDLWLLLLERLLFAYLLYLCNYP